jgi:hypothetical protein
VFLQEYFGRHYDGHEIGMVSEVIAYKRKLSLTALCRSQLIYKRYDTHSFDYQLFMHITFLANFMLVFLPLLEMAHEARSSSETLFSS